MNPRNRRVVSTGCCGRVPGRTSRSRARIAECSFPRHFVRHIVGQFLPFVFLLMLSGCANDGPRVRVSNGNSTSRFDLPRFSLAEIVSRTWQQDAHTVTLLLQVDLPTADSKLPDCKAMMFGFSDTQKALCIEFYAYDSLCLDERRYLLMERDWDCPPVATSVTFEKQNGRVFFRVEGDSVTNGSVIHDAYAYELTSGFRLLRMPSEFEGMRSKP
jgi:hypothetical protein